MAIKKTVIIQCDHIHKYGKEPARCGEENQQDRIPVTQPMYHIEATISTIDGDSGEVVLLKRNLHTCWFCLYHEISDMYDVAKQNREQRQIDLDKHLEAMNNDE
jgi:hypothetical protein